jgi:hypothetical protein
VITLVTASAQIFLGGAGVTIGNGFPLKNGTDGTAGAISPRAQVALPGVAAACTSSAGRAVRLWRSSHRPPNNEKGVIQSVCTYVGASAVPSYSWRSSRASRGLLGFG